MSQTTTRLLPTPTPETAAFWQATKNGELLLQHCCNCEKPYFPPRPFCPSCGSGDIQEIAASGDATLWSYVISMRPAPGIEAPYVVAAVKLREGVTMMTNVINCPASPDHLHLDMPLRVLFVQLSDEVTLPLFEPAGAAA